MAGLRDRHSDKLQVCFPATGRASEIDFVAPSPSLSEPDLAPLWILIQFQPSPSHFPKLSIHFSILRDALFSIFFFLSLAIILVRLSPQQIVSFEFFFILKFLRMELFSIFGAKKQNNDIKLIRNRVLNFRILLLKNLCNLRLEGGQITFNNFIIYKILLDKFFSKYFKILPPSLLKSL